MKKGFQTTIVQAQVAKNITIILEILLYNIHRKLMHFCMKCMALPL